MSLYLTNKRPNFGPKQIRTKEELVVGDIYTLIDREGYECRVKLLKEPFLDNGLYRISFLVTHGHFQGNTRESYLTDYGVEIGDNNLWNATNHILRHRITLFSFNFKIQAKIKIGK